MSRLLDCSNFHFSSVDLNGKIFSINLKKDLALQIIEKSSDDMSSRVLYQSGGFWGPVHDNLLTFKPDLDNMKIVEDGIHGTTALIPCFVRNREDLNVCSRGLMKRELTNILHQMPEISLGIEFDFYVFDKEQFSQHLKNREAKLKPINRLDILKIVSSLGEEKQYSFNRMAINPVTNQISLSLSLDKPFAVVDNYMMLQKELIERSTDLGMYPCFVPKINDLAPSGLNIIIKTSKNLNSEVTNHAVAGILNHARSLAAITNSQINSYKRLTPKKIVEGWNIPCFASWSHSFHENSVVWWNKDKPDELIVRQADSYSNIYLVLAGLFGSMAEGINQEISVEKFENQKFFNASKLPSNLGEAAKEFASSEFARKLLGQPLHEVIAKQKAEEWEIYCDEVHPWEIERGLRRWQL